jgi:hypothetical protein
MTGKPKGENAMKLFLIILTLQFSFASLAIARDVHSKDITVYKNPDCSCCNKWIKYLKSNKYNVTEINTRDVYAEKKRLGVPEKLAACHTAVIDGYVVEGHATNRDIKKLLLFRPDVKGIAIPGMPIGSPGMEKGNIKEQYNVMSFDSQGNVEVFRKH